MITAAQIAPYREASDDYDCTENLKRRFAILRSERKPLHLNKNEFEDILRWKLRGQYNRGKGQRSVNTEERICMVTGTALTITHPHKDYERELRTAILCLLHGVGVPIASAVLALVFPEEYAVIDFRGWRQVFGENKREFSITQYKKYLKEIVKLADELDWLPQEVDLAIWEYDKVN